MTSSTIRLIWHLLILQLSQLVDVFPSHNTLDITLALEIKLIDVSTTL